MKRVPIFLLCEAIAKTSPAEIKCYVEQKKSRSIYSITFTYTRWTGAQTHAFARTHTTDIQHSWQMYLPYSLEFMLFHKHAVREKVLDRRKIRDRSQFFSSLRSEGAVAPGILRKIRRRARSPWLHIKKCVYYKILCFPFWTKLSRRVAFLCFLSIWFGQKWVLTNISDCSRMRERAVCYIRIKILNLTPFRATESLNLMIKTVMSRGKHRFPPEKFEYWCQNRDFQQWTVS